MEKEEKKEEVLELRGNGAEFQHKEEEEEEEEKKNKWWI